MRDWRKDSSQFVKFLVVGGFATGVNYGLFYVLLQFLRWPYQLASATGFVIGIGIGYPLNKLWTYEDKSKTTVGFVLNYIAVYIFSLVANLCVLYLLVHMLNVDARWANIAAIGVSTCTNFIGTKFLVFRKSVP